MLSPQRVTWVEWGLTSRMRSMSAWKDKTRSILRPASVSISCAALTICKQASTSVFLRVKRTEMTLKCLKVSATWEIKDFYNNICIVVNNTAEKLKLSFSHNLQSFPQKNLPVKVLSTILSDYNIWLKIILTKSICSLSKSPSKWFNLLHCYH